MTDKATLLALADRVEAGQVSALSIKQPYPHHIFNDGKDVENRDWFTTKRGWVIVHAGKKDDEDRKLIRAKSMPLGGVVGMMRIDDCVSDMDSRWFYGKFGFVIGKAFPLPLIPCRGQLGFFKLDVQSMAETAAALRAMAWGVE
jgi:hypothetical protein